MNEVLKVGDRIIWSLPMIELATSYQKRNITLTVKEIHTDLTGTKIVVMHCIEHEIQSRTEIGPL